MIGVAPKRRGEVDDFDAARCEIASKV